MFYECPKVAVLWNAVEQWILNRSEHIKVDKHMILFGIIKNVLLNWLIVNIKYYIYITKIRKGKLNKDAIKNIRPICEKLNVEHFIFYKSCN